MCQTVEILMATFNGEKYIGEQIDSIIGQTYSNWKLLIRDDGSTDRTISIIKEYQEKDERIILIDDTLGNLGQCLNFKELLKKTNNDTIKMFSDQDDIWKSNKIEISLDHMLKSMKVNDKVLLYTNYFTFSENITNSVLEYKVNMSYKNEPNKILVQNWLMGCTMMISPKISKVAMDIPKIAENHDNWFAIIASLCGEIVYLHEPTMYHRIHEKNVTTNIKTKKFSSRVKRVFNSIKNKKNDLEKRVELLKYIDNVLSLVELDEKKQCIYDKYKKIITNPQKKNIIVVLKNKFSGFTFTRSFLFTITVM